MLALKWIKILARILLYVTLFAFFCSFYMIDQMRDFVKGRTTLTSRIEEVESLEPPTVTVCMYPPYKPSKLASFSVTEPGLVMFDKDLNNTNLKNRINLFSYQLGQDFGMNLWLELAGNMVFSWNATTGIETIGNYSFEVQPIFTIPHGKCYKIQPLFEILTPGFALKLNISVNPIMDQSDVPTSIILYLTSNNTWQGITTNDWPQFSPSKLELDRSSWENKFIFTVKPTEYLFDTGEESSEECWKEHLMKSNCSVKCVFASFTDLPMCQSGKEIFCIIEAGHQANLWSICNRKKRALTFPGEMLKIPLTMDRNPSTHSILLRIDNWSMMKLIKEEIMVISLADLIGSLGGSLGMFFGFSISAYLMYLIDKCIMRAMSQQRVGSSVSNTPN